MILFCEVPPPEGGETPIVPSFRVTERMSEEYPEIVEELEMRGLRYTFTALSKNDTSSMRGRGWEDAFGTSDREEAEKRYSLRLPISVFPNLLKIMPSIKCAIIFSQIKYFELPYVSVIIINILLFQLPI